MNNNKQIIIDYDEFLEMQEDARQLNQLSKQLKEAYKLEVHRHAAMDPLRTKTEFTTTAHVNSTIIEKIIKNHVKENIEDMLPKGLEGMSDFHDFTVDVFRYKSLEK